MNHSLYLMAAAWLASAGQPAPLPVGPAQPATQPVYSSPIDPSAPMYSYQPQAYQPQESKPGFFGRLKSKLSGLFHKKPCGSCSSPQQPQQYQIVPVPVQGGEPPLADQISFQQFAYPQNPAPAQAPAPVQKPAAGSEEASEEANAATQEISKKFISKIGHEEDYSWVTGQLYLVRTGQGKFWVVRYATVDTEDKFGGSVVLAPAVSMRNFREGDLVSVKGEVMSEGRANKHLGGALYRVESIDMIERAD